MKIFQFTDEFKDAVSEWTCKTFHIGDHEVYDECVDPNGSYGPSWDHGMRCKKCGRKWPDPVYEKQRDREWRTERSEKYYLKFGTTDSQIMCYGGKWQDLDWFHKQYECIRGILKEEKKDIGLIEDKYFVFVDDCKQLDPPVQNPYFPNSSWSDEWNLLSNWPGLRTPMTPEATDVWNKRKLTYTQAVEKVKNTVKDERYINW